MHILGVDPGLRNTGFALVDEKTARIVSTGLIQFPDRYSGSLEEYISYSLNRLLPVLEIQQQAAGVQYAAVEVVQWQGRMRAITLPLAHAAGAIVGALLARGLTVFTLPPGAKYKKGKEYQPRRKASWSDHEYDAVLLARRALMYLRAVNAEDADSPSTLRAQSAISRHIISAPLPAPGAPTTKG